ncbi:MAG: hypothetical protein BGO98_35000 [Myxococcales bacterium 68-20]|nr:MAG: hypothetical protein BGO98_35000 [Myxococcales bacterium 68-20]
MGGPCPLRPCPLHGAYALALAREATGLPLPPAGGLRHELVRHACGGTVWRCQKSPSSSDGRGAFDARYEERAAARAPNDDLLIISTDGVR